MIGFGDGFEEDYDYVPTDSTDVRCKVCGVDGLSWIHTGTRWRLANSKGLHTCATKPSADDFDVVDT